MRSGLKHGPSGPLTGSESTIRIAPTGVLGRGGNAPLITARDHSPHDPCAPASLPPTSCHPRRSGITGTVEGPLEGGSCPNRTQRTPTTFHRATQTAESRGSIRRAQCSMPPLYPIWTLPPLQGPPHVRAAWEVAFTSITAARARPDQDGAPHVTPPTCPPRGPSFFCRADPTSSDQVAGSCGRSRSDNLAP